MYQLCWLRGRTLHRQAETRDNRQIKTTDRLRPVTHSEMHGKWLEEKSTVISEKLVLSHLLEALKCNFIYKCSIRFNVKTRLPCLSKPISETESREIRLYKNWRISRHFLRYIGHHTSAELPFAHDAHGRP